MPAGEARVEMVLNSRRKTGGSLSAQPAMRQLAVRRVVTLLEDQKRKLRPAYNMSLALIPPCSRYAERIASHVRPRL
jgi:hypothetical protein